MSPGPKKVHKNIQSIRYCSVLKVNFASRIINSCLVFRKHINRTIIPLFEIPMLASKQVMRIKKFCKIKQTMCI